MSDRKPDKRPTNETDRKGRGERRRSKRVTVELEPELVRAIEMATD